ncbi:MAG: recombinase RecT [Polaribacter sp.]|nr:recombinase RecT [Polaribacter sp.]
MAWINTQSNEIVNSVGKVPAMFDSFCAMCESMELDPTLREIYILLYKGKPSWFISRDGARKVAQRNKDYEYHTEIAVYENDTLEVVSGEVTHKSSFKDRGALVGAYCLVKRKGASIPAYNYVDFKEYNTGYNLWQTKPVTMICKVACFDSETEILTKNGFVRFDKLQDQEVAQVDKNKTYLL